MLIVDSQVHIWGANTPKTPWPKDHIKPHRDTPFMKEELLSQMITAGVDCAVLVPPIWQGDSNEFALEAARSHPQRFSVMGRIDTSTEASKELICGWRSQPGLMGIRVVPRREPLRSQWANGQIDWLWAECAKAQVPVMVLIDIAQINLIVSVAQRHPELKIILDHLCLPSGAKDEAAFGNIEPVLALAQYPNIAVKASSMPSFTKDTYPFLSLHTPLRRFYDAFGPQRMFWGTDLSHIPCTYQEALHLFTQALPWLTQEDKTWMMGRGICEWIDWRNAGAVL